MKPSESDDSEPKPEDIEMRPSESSEPEEELVQTSSEIDMNLSKKYNDIKDVSYNERPI
jgi:hypothetical protein